MRETSLWHSARTGLSPYALLERIENVAAAGTPDVHYLAGCHAGWLELKHAKEWPKRDDSRVFGGHGLRPEQKAWLHRYSSRGGRAFVLARVASATMLVPASYAREFNEMDRKTLEQVSVFWSPSARVAWSTMAAFL